MSEVSENELNVKLFLKKEILQYYNITFFERKRNNNIRAVTFKLDANVYEVFIKTLMDNGFRPYGNVGLMVESLLRLFNETFRSPKVVQTTLFYKPQINVEQKFEVNVAQKIELKIVKKDLTGILESLEKKKGNLDFYLSKLRETLPRAVKVYERSGDHELKMLLEKAEKYI